MFKIKSVIAHEIFDSRGNPTIEVACVLSDGSKGVASVPSGASTGTNEAHELRDGDTAYHNGKGVKQAIQNVNKEINEHIAGKLFDQQTLDATLCALDSTKNKIRLGANALLGVSLAFAKAVAISQGIPLHLFFTKETGHHFLPRVPSILCNILNGGKHATNGLAIQEYMVVPVGGKTVAEQVKIALSVMDALKKILHNEGNSTELGDEGGFTPSFSSDEDPFVYITRAIVEAGYTFAECAIAIDCAATSFFDNGTYVLRDKGVTRLYSGKELIEWYVSLADKYPIISIEDPFEENEFQLFAALADRLKGRVRIVGDDLTTTNAQRMEHAASMNAITAVIIKPNQIGTVSETLDAITFARGQHWDIIISHRSGETNDTAIADLAVGVGARFLKAGAPSREERLVKYRRLIEIEKNFSL